MKYLIFLLLLPLSAFPDCNVESIQFEQFKEALTNEELVNKLSKCSSTSLQQNPALVRDYIEVLNFSISNGELDSIEKAWRLHEMRLVDHSNWFTAAILNSMTSDHKSEIVKRVIGLGFVKEICGNRSSYYSDTPEWNLKNEKVFKQQLINQGSPAKHCFD